MQYRITKPKKRIKLKGSNNDKVKQSLEKQLNTLYEVEHGFIYIIYLAIDVSIENTILANTLDKNKKNKEAYYNDLCKLIYLQNQLKKMLDEADE